MQRAAQRRAAVLDPAEIQAFQQQQQQQQHQQQLGGSGLIAVGHPHPAAGPGLGGSRTVALEDYPGQQLPQELHGPYRRMAVNPQTAGPVPVHAHAHAAGPLVRPIQRPQHQVPVHGSPPSSVGPSMGAAQYNAYLAASNAIPGGHPTPRSLVQLQNQTAANMNAGGPQRPIMMQQQQQQHSSRMLPQHAVQGRSPAAMGLPAGHPGHPMRMQQMEQQHQHPGAGMMEAQGMSPHIQQVYRVASQPQLSARSQHPPGPVPIAPRPGLPAQRSVSQTQVPQARPRTIDLSPHTQPIQPQQVQRHAYSTALHQQMQQQQGPHPRSLQQAVMSGQPVPQAQQPQQQPGPQPGPQQRVAAAGQNQMKSSPLAQPASTAQDRPSPLQLDTQAARPDAATPGPVSAVSVTERRRSTSVQTLIANDRRMSVSPAMLATPTPQNAGQTPAQDLNGSQASARKSPMPPPQQMQPDIGLYPVAEESFGPLPPNAILHPSPLGFGTLRLLQLGQGLTSALAQPGNDSLHAWIRNFYSPDAHVKFNLCDTDHGLNVYEIPISALARFYEVMRESGASSFQLLLESPREYTVHTSPDGPAYTHYVECSEMTWIVSYSSGCQVFSRGVLRATLDEVIPSVDAAGRPTGSNVQIRHIEYTLEHHTEVVKRSALVPKPSAPMATTTSAQGSTSTASQPNTSPLAHNFFGEAASPMKEDATTASPGSDGQSGKRKRTDSGHVPSKKGSGDIKVIDFADHSPSTWSECLVPAAVSSMAGLSDRAVRILEIAESVDRLSEIISFSHTHGFGPLESLQRYATYCVASGASSAEGLYSPPSVSAVPPVQAAGPQSASTVPTGSSPPNSGKSSHFTVSAPPPTAPLPSIPRMHETLPNGMPAAFSMPNSPVELDSSMFYRSNTQPVQS